MGARKIQGLVFMQRVLYPLSRLLSYTLHIFTFFLTH